MTVRHRRLRIALRLAAVVAVLGATAWVAIRTGTSFADIASVASVRAHLLATAILLGDLTLRGVRMSLLAHCLRLRVPVTAAVASQLAGEAAAALTPSRVGADAGRMAVLARRGVDLARSGAIVVAEMLFEVAALIAVAALLMLSLHETRAAIAGVIAYVAAVLTTTVGSILLARSAPQAPPAWYVRLRLPVAPWRGLQRTTGAFSAACIELGRLRATRMMLLVSISALHIVGRLAILPALLSDALPASMVGPAIGWPMLLLYAGALVPVPGGGGAIEIGFAAALGPMLANDVGAALVWWRFYTFHLPAVGGGVVLAWLAMTRRRPDASAQPLRCAHVTTDDVACYEAP